MLEKSEITGVDARFSIEDIEVNPRRNTLKRDGEEISIEPRLMRIIVRLANSNGDIVERSELIKEISDQTLISDESLTQAISKIRQVLGDQPKDPRFIKTIPRKGYILLSPVNHTVENHQEPDQRKNSQPAASSKIDVIAKSGRKKHLFYGISLVVFIVIAALILWPDNETIFIEKGEIEFIEKEE